MAPTLNTTSVDYDPFASPAIARTAPSTEAQREIWLAASNGTEASLSYNESVSYHLRGELDLPAMRAALQDLVDRHDALRCTFSADGLTLCLSASLPLEVPFTDLAGFDAADRERRLAERLRRHVDEPFDLEHGPLVRAEIVRREAHDHLVILTAHHIVCDGWSFWVLTKDLAAFYSARSHGQTPVLVPAESFAEYAAAEAARGRTPESMADEAYWLGRFSDDLPVLDLPTDRPRPPLKTYTSEREDYLLDSALVDEVKKTGARAGASFFTTLLAAFKVLLHRLSGQSDLVVGIPAAGQSVGGHDTLVGHCVNVLPLRTRLEPATRFDELLKAVRTTMLDAYEHQQYTYGTLLQKLPIDRDPSRLPLVSVVFNIDQALAGEARRFEGLDFEFASNPRRYENFDLFVNAMETGGALRLECQYNSDILDRATLRRWLAAFESLLRAFAQDPARGVGQAPLLGEQEKELLRTWNETGMDFPETACIHELIAERAARTPERVAVQGDDRSLTYGQLETRSNQLARRLRAAGVRRDSLVGLCLERTPELLVGLLGILKAGGGYVPLDPGFPQDRLQFMVEDSGMKLLVTESRLRDRVPGGAAQTLILDEEWGRVTAESGASLGRDDASAAPDSVAYVIYTSGSTGRPKGVVVPHRCVVNLVTSVGRTPGMSERDVVLAVTTLSFDIAVSEVILPLVVGARVVLVGREVATDGERLREAIERSEVTFIDATPATWRLLLASGWAGSPRIKGICTGEAMPRDLATELIDRLGSLWNGYGPTETTVWSTFHEVKRPLGRILIGRPVGNTQIHVLDAHQEPVPVGVVGELWIGGAGVTRGYLNRPELTEERFIPDPFRREPGARLYRTGDLARYQADGNLECLGRNDFQVKVRGYRIELGEIEAALAAHPSVAQAVAMAREDRPGDVRLVAYVVAKAGSSADAESLLQHLGQRLPEYMVPAHVVPLDALPLLPNGKINRKALPPPSAAPAGPGSDYVEPRTEAEKLLAGVWQEALSVPRVSVHDNFFRLGGHSLLAAQVLARLRREHGVHLPFRFLFEAPTLEQFAKGIEEASRAAGETLHVPRRAQGGLCPLTLAQERALLLDEMEPRQAVVRRLGSAFRLRGRLDLPALRRAIGTIVARHETLRSVFVWRDGAPLRDVLPATLHETPLLDWSDRPPPRQEEELVPFLRHAAREPFDFAKGPMFESRVIRLGEEDHVLFFRTHSIVWDGWSFDIFRRELAALYAELTGGPPAALPDLPVNYGDFAAWHREWMQSPEITRQTAYWREQLKGELPALELPTDHPRDEALAFEAATETSRLTESEAHGLTALAHEAGGTLFTVLLAAFKVLLHRWTGQAELLVGTPVRARNLPETENLIGPFVNAVALHSQIDPGLSFRDYLARLKGVTLDAFSNQEMPLELLGRQAPVLRAFFSLQDTRTRSLVLGNLALEQIPGVSPGGASDLTLWLMEEKDGLLAALNYRKDLFEAPTMRRLLAQYRHLLRAILADPGRPLGRLPLVAPGESPALVPAAAGGPRAAAPAHRRFAEQARRTPTAIALACGDATVSYGDLLGRVLALAARLRSQGLAPGEPTAVFCSRPIERVVASLAVLEAGGAVLAVDPDDPLDRVKVVLRHAAVRRAVTDEELHPEIAALGIEALPLTGVPSSAADTAGPEPGRESPAWLLHVPEPAGPPTVVAVPHRALAPMLDAGRDVLGLTAGDVVLAVARPADEGAIAELLLPLGLGARLVLDEDDLLGDPLRLAQRIAETGAAAVLCPPDTWAALVAESWPGAPALKAVCVSGTLEPAVAAELRARVGGLWTAWGVAEAGPWAALFRVESAEEAQRLREPLPGVVWTAVDPDLLPVPPGIVGELVIGGAVVADTQGPARPAPERFARLGTWGRVHRTGHRVRRRDDGGFDLLPRADERRTVRGARVEIGEIEAALNSNEDVGEAAVLLSARRRGGSELVAYVAGRDGRSPTPADLRRQLRRRLPGRMVPASFVILDDAVRLPDGRIDRRALPELQAVRERAGRARIAPRTPLEKAIAEVWQEMLQVETVGVDDNFFDLGGHSLLATIVAHRVQQKTGRRPGLRALMFQTLEQLARALEADAPVAAAPRGA